MPPNALYDMDISEICRDGRETLPIPAELRVTMHKLGGEGKAQGGRGEVYSQGVEPQGREISLILCDFFSKPAVQTVEPCHLDGNLAGAVL